MPLSDTHPDALREQIRLLRGGEVSEVQWRDVLGILRVQEGALDLDYLRRWGDEIGVLDLLERALEDVDE